MGHIDDLLQHHLVLLGRSGNEQVKNLPACNQRFPFVTDLTFYHASIETIVASVVQTHLGSASADH